MLAFIPALTQPYPNHINGWQRTVVNGNPQTLSLVGLAPRPSTPRPFWKIGEGKMEGLGLSSLQFSEEAWFGGSGDATKVLYINKY